MCVQRTGNTQELSEPVSLGTHGGRLGEPVISVDRDNVQVADPFQLIVSINVAQDSTVRFPVLPSSLGPFNVISHRDFFDVPIEGGRSWTRVVELETFESGNLLIPAISLVVDNETKTTSSVQMTVESLLDPSSELTEFRASKDVEEIPVESSLWQWWLLGTLVMTALLGAAWFAFTRYRRRTSHENWAIKQLDALTNSLAFHQKDQTTVLPSAADILRGYIQRKFGIAATQQTTEEFLRRIQFDPILETEQKDDLRKFLSHVDKIKFAHLVPQEDQLQETVALVRTFVRRCGDAKSETQTSKLVPVEPAKSVNAAGNASQQIDPELLGESSKNTSSTSEGDAGNVVAH